MRAGLFVALVAAAAALGACGRTGLLVPTDADVDGVADADLDDVPDAEPDVESEPQGGPVTLVASAITMTDDRLYDFDGDGDVDNAVADLDASGAEFFMSLEDVFLGSAVAGGERVVLHMPWIDDLAVPEDPSAILMLFRAVDTDAPALPGDDFSGDESFFVAAPDLDACGEPLRHLDAAIEGGALEANGGSVALRLRYAGFRPLTLLDARISGTVASLGAYADLSLCGYATIRNLGRLGFDTEEGFVTLLEAFVSGFGQVHPEAPLGLSPDVDVDADGLELFVLDEQAQIALCLDGNGTAILGRDCWQDPRMADGFALCFRLVTISAGFAGREPGWEAVVQGECENPPATSLFDPV